MTTNNNRFAMIYKDLTESEQVLIGDIKNTAGILYNLFCKTTPNREISIAITNLEQAIMWAVKGVCVNHKGTDDEQ